MVMIEQKEKNHLVAFYFAGGSLRYDISQHDLLCKSPSCFDTKATLVIIFPLIYKYNGTKSVIIPGFVYVHTCSFFEWWVPNSY